MTKQGLMDGDIDHILVSEEQIRARVKELGEQISRDYAGEEIVLLRNPLPVPRKKKHLRQEFAFPDPEWNTEDPDLDYDYQTDDDDDFDL